jgi:ethanolamine utilization protein EutQ (cupin superfamily)
VSFLGSTNHIFKYYIQQAELCMVMEGELDVIIEAFTAMKMQVMIILVVMPHNGVIKYHHSGGPCCLHLHSG